MSTLYVHSTQSPAAPAEGRRRNSWPAVFGRTVVRALIAVGRTFAASSVLWWLGLPWQSHWPSSWKGGRP